MFSVFSLATTVSYMLMLYLSPLGVWEKVAFLLGLLLIKGIDYWWGRKDESSLYEKTIMPAFVEAVEKKFGLDTQVFIKDKENPTALTFNADAANDLKSYLDKKEEEG